MRIIIALEPTSGYSCPSFDVNKEGEITLCEDGLDKDDLIRYCCPECGYILFTTKDLDWVAGYWASPFNTLKKEYYKDGRISCPQCNFSTGLCFFSYIG